MSDDETTTDDELDEVPRWVFEASMRCSGLSSQEQRVRAAEQLKRKREEEAAAAAAARQAQEEQDARLAAEMHQEELRQLESIQVPARPRPTRQRRDEVHDLTLDSPVGRSSPRRAVARRTGASRAGEAVENQSPQHVVTRGASRSVCPQHPAEAALNGPRDHQSVEFAEAPSALRVASLYPYQRAALAWLLRREGAMRSSAVSEGSGGEADAQPLVRGGILADEQGMGKTVQMLSLCLSNTPSLSSAPVGSMLSTGRPALGVLIVCPFMLAKQWEGEQADPRPGDAARKARPLQPATPERALRAQKLVG